MRAFPTCRIVGFGELKLTGCFFFLYSPQRSPITGFKIPGGGRFTILSRLEPFDVKISSKSSQNLVEMRKYLDRISTSNLDRNLVDFLSKCQQIDLEIWSIFFSEMKHFRNILKPSDYCISLWA